MRILITGGAGYIGTATVMQLNKRGYELTVVDNLVRGFKTAALMQTDFIQADLTDALAIENIFQIKKFDLIIHLAALAYVKESVEQPEKYLINNVVSTQNVIHCAQKYDVNKIIFSSSCTVYGNLHQKAKVSEGDDVAPINPYGKSKFSCERIIAESGLQYLILRYFNVAGADPLTGIGLRTEFASHLIHALSKAVVKKTSVPIYGLDYKTADGSCVRDYIHVSDVALIHELAVQFLKQENKCKEIINCGYGAGYSVLEIVEQFEKINSVKLPKEYLGRRGGDPDYLVGDNLKLKSMLGWKSQFADPLYTICRSALAWEMHLLRQNLTS